VQAPLQQTAVFLEEDLDEAREFAALEAALIGGESGGGRGQKEEQLRQRLEQELATVGQADYRLTVLTTELTIPKSRHLKLRVQVLYQIRLKYEKLISRTFKIGKDRITCKVSNCMI
jgi:hypothetical protein